MSAAIAERTASPAKTPSRLVPSFDVSWARNGAQVGEAQRLRFRVFVGELGASLQLAPGAPAEHDIDRYDAHCDHLLVRAQGGPQDGQVVATCRLLTPEGAVRAGGLYTDSEFDLRPLRDLLPRTIEMGRVCIDPAWRNGMLVLAMWRAVGERMADRHLDTMIGCSSVSMSDGGDLATQLWWRLKSTHLAATAIQVRPRKALGLDRPPPPQTGSLPTLMKAYLRCGGRLLGPPSVDADFHTADFPMIVHLADLPTRYVKRVFASGA